MLRSYIYKPDYIDNTIDLNSNAAKELDWMSFWEQLFVKSVNSSLDSFAHLNEELKKEQNSEKKTLPMNLEEDALTASEEKSMIQSGYLTPMEKNYIYRKLYVSTWISIRKRSTTSCTVVTS